MKRRLLRKPGLFVHTKIANVFMYADREVAISVVLPKLEIHTYQTNLGEGLILCGAKDAQKKKLHSHAIEKIRENLENETRA